VSPSRLSCRLIPKPSDHASELRRSKGFTLVELMVAMALSLVLLGIAMTLLDELYNVCDLASSEADVNQNLRVAVNIIARDLATTGGGIPLGGIPLPGGGGATPIKRPGPGVLGTNNFSASPNLNVITPGPGLGPPAGSTPLPTDEVTMITVNSSSQLNQSPLANITLSTTSASITVDAGTNIGPGSASQVLPGQLIMLTNANSSCILTATEVNPATNVITFNYNDSNGEDALGLNQFPGGPTNPAQGTIGQLQTPGPPATFPPTTAYPITMVSYYLSATTPPSLLRQVGGGAAQQVAREINLLQFSYDLSDGTTFDARTVSTPNQIRQVNLTITAVAQTPNRKTGQYYSNAIDTSVTVQNLAFFNKY
jgi:prepilin-type N-terminal cleavage/methylation domain-containing protein